MKALGLLALLTVLLASVAAPSANSASNPAKGEIERVGPDKVGARAGRAQTASGGGTSSPDGSVAGKEKGKPAEVQLEERVRESRNRVRRIRRKLRKARENGNEDLARGLREKLQRAKVDRKRRRGALLAAMERGEVSPRYRRLKRSIREDLNAVRRARYALKRAVRRSDNRAAVKAQERLRKAKRKLKRRRQMLRRVMRAFRGHRRGAPSANNASGTAGPKARSADEVGAAREENGNRGETGP